jgi:hypothetical protein
MPYCLSPYRRAILGLLLFMFAYAAGATTTTRIVIQKREDPYGRVTLPADAAQLAANSGFTELADYDVMTVFRGPADRGTAFLAALQARGYNATSATELDAVSFHDLRIDADSGPIEQSVGPSSSILSFLILESFPKDSWLQELSSRGVRLLGPLPPAGYLVRADSRALELLELELPYIRGVYSLPNSLKTVGTGRTDHSADARSAFVIQVAEEAAEESLEELLASRSDAPVVILDRAPGRTTYQAALDDTDIAVLAAIDRVFEIAPVGHVGLSSERQSQLIAKPGKETGGGATLPSSNSVPYVNWLATKFTLTENTFNNTKVGVIDTGFDNANISYTGIHPDFRFTFNGSQYTIVTDQTNSWFTNDDRDYHGTLVSSVIAGYPFPESSRKDAEGYLYGLGVAPTVRLAMDKYINCTVEGGTFDAAVARVLGRGANVVNASLNVLASMGGCSYTTAYSRVVDDRTRANGLLFTIAAGNSTEGCNPNYVRAPGTAKNGLTLGSTDNFTIPWPNSSSLGTCPWCAPTGAQDARRIPSFSAIKHPTSLVKPDLVAPSTRVPGPKSRGGTGCNVILCNSNLTDSSDPGATYAMVAGTSFAAPAAAGAAAVVRKWYRNIKGVDPSPSMSKAMLINGARDIAGAIVRDPNYAQVGTVGHIPDQYQGWGMLSFERLFGGASDYYFLDQTITLNSTGAQWTKTVFVRNGGKNTHFTLTWADPSQIAEGAQYTAINNLYLQVCGGAPQVCYNGNHININTGLSLQRPPAALVLDSINNVERVIIGANKFATGTALTIRVTAYSLPQPGQNFAVVSQNAGE